ncbi:LysR family transcriptional regulator [Curtobacterium ammoniigenes]|uniref:LysR family transcriptional regulator n=1 Tax=Curtobacterium ammoniigenes TaxID=395387 RepID=UPI000833C463|nr:LysR family transcriptional regulator [Curtobacterium ammoniigenes]
MPELDLDAMRILVTVVETGSAAATAARLHISPQAVSARVQRMEGQLERALFVRSTTGMQPTEAGVLIAEWAAEVLTADHTFRDRLSTLTERPHSRVRVAASLTIAEHLMPSWVVRLAAEHDADIDLAVANSEEVVDRLRDGDIDLGFIETVDVPHDLHRRTIARDELILVASPAHPIAQRASVTLSELARTPLVTRESGSGTRSSFERLCAEHGYTALASPEAVVPTSAGVRAAAIAGVAPAVLSALAVRDDLALGRLVHVTITDARLVRPLTAVWRQPFAKGSSSDRLLDVAQSTTPR